MRHVALLLLTPGISMFQPRCARRRDSNGNGISPKPKLASH
jgi:hypothetical protein